MLITYKWIIDKIRKILLEIVQKSNVSGTTSKSNNAIQKMQQDLLSVIIIITENMVTESMIIKITRASSSLVADVKKLYRDEFDEAKEEYNAEQTKKIMKKGKEYVIMQ